MTKIEVSLYEGHCVSVRTFHSQILELRFDRQDGAVNKLDAPTLAGLKNAIAVIAARTGTAGVVLTSAKKMFVVGADIGEFLPRLTLSEQAILADVRSATDAFKALEDLGIPTVAALSGHALGGGLELALACTFRVASAGVQVGLPEVKLGLIPGAGGHVRLPRIAGTAVASEWISGGKTYDADEALAAGVLDAVCPADALRDTCLEFLQSAARDDQIWRARHRRKCAPLAGAVGPVDWQANPVTAVRASLELLESCAALGRDEALERELRTFARIVKTPEAATGLRAFVDAQEARRLARRG